MFELQVWTKSCNKRKGVDHEIGIVFCLPTRGWKRVRRVRFQKQLLVQMNLAKIEKSRFFYRGNGPSYRFWLSLESRGKRLRKERVLFLFNLIIESRKVEGKRQEHRSYIQTHIRKSWRKSIYLQSKYIKNAIFIKGGNIVCP